MLQLKNIRKAYTTESFTQVALNDVSINFRDNEFVAILGPSGSGKTTLLNIVGGLDHYDSGDLVIDGTSTKEYRDRDWDAYRNNRIGFVFQSYNLIPHQTVLENVELALTLSGVGKEERHARAREALEKVGLAEHIDKKPSQLSGGQMQRVAIARALINDPEILLADEPTGALDSKTSVQIMDLLTEIATDRLVIMVTHNPELADEYANRIVNLHDGVVDADTNPFEVADDWKPEDAKPLRHTSMNFMTALSLSFKNLMTKKGRTIMTAFAGSIGIIGIAAILALANGVNHYIDTVEEETLSQYPLQITSTGFDMTGMIAGADSEADLEGGGNDASEGASADSDAAASADAGNSNANGEGKVRVAAIMTTMFGSLGSNDLASLKTYLDSGAGGIESNINAIEYKYNLTPQVFLSDTSDGAKKVNPDTSFAALGMGSGSSNSMISTMYSTDVFYEMPKNTDLFMGQYEVKAGKWPESANECVLVVSRNGAISDFMLYAMGLRDKQELKDMLTQFMEEQDVQAPTDVRDYSYDEILGITFKLVHSCDYYEYDGTYGVWKDRSEDDAVLRGLVEAGEDLKIVGIVQPAPDQKVTMLRSGINYPYALTEHLIDVASESQIVKEQVADDKVDVITGKTFAAEAEESGSSFDMGSLFSIDEAALMGAFSMDPSALTIDQDKLIAAVAAAGIPDFPQPREDELGITLDDSTAAAVANTSSLLLYSYIAENPGISAAEAAAGFPAWVEGGGTVVDPATGQTVTASQMLQGVVALGTGIAALPANLGAYLVRAVSEYTQALIGSTMAATAQNVGEQLGTALAGAMSIDTNAFANAFSFNLQSEDLAQVMSSMMNTEERSYANNIKNFGYADRANPAEIDIFPRSFEDKEAVTAALDAYNDSMEAAGEDDKVISYTDIVGALMSSVTTIVNMISTVLIAFVAISLVVSSIMIGVITYISVLERRKEIGILRSIGASKGDISRVFNAETVIEGLIAGVLGIAVTALLCIPVNIIVYAVRDVPNIALLPPLAAVVLIFISVVLTFIAGLIPSSSAARQDPVEALRSE